VYFTANYAKGTRGEVPAWTRNTSADEAYQENRKKIQYKNLVIGASERQREGSLPGDVGHSCDQQRKKKNIKKQRAAALVAFSLGGSNTNMQRKGEGRDLLWQEGGG